MATSQTGQEINRFPDRHHDPEIQLHPSLLARGASDFFQPVGHVRLGLEIKLHVRVDGKGIKALPADSFPLAIIFDRATVDAEPIGFAHGAFNLS